MKTAEEFADKLWEDCRGAPKASAIPFIKKALAAYAEEQTKAQFIGDKDHYEERIKQARAEALEEAAKVVQGDVLETSDEFEGVTKLKVFDLLDRLAAKISALKSTP